MSTPFVRATVTNTIFDPTRLQFDDVRFVNVSFETYGTPAANIPVFVASNNRWGLVADVIQARLGAAGLGVRIEKLEGNAIHLNSALVSLE